MLTTARRICGKIMHPQTALHSQWDKGWKNNSQFASLSIRRPTIIPGRDASQNSFPCGPAAFPPTYHIPRQYRIHSTGICTPGFSITGHPSCLTVCHICYSPDPAILLSAITLHLPFFLVNVVVSLYAFRLSGSKKAGMTL